MNKDANRIIDVWTDDVRVYARTEGGLVASYAFDSWERLKKATPAQRNDFYLSFSGIHWPQIDEDLSFTGMFISSGLCEIDTTEEVFYYTKPGR
jgi:hypothetical protein